MKTIAATTALLLALAACSASPSTEQTSPEPAPTSEQTTEPSQPSEQPSEPTEDPTEAPSEESSEEPSASAPPVETDSPTESTEPEIAWMTGPQHNDIFPDLEAQLHPSAQRFGVHEGYERIVIDYTGSGQLGWSAEYTTTPTYEGSGNPVELTGSTFLVINVSGAMVDMADQSTWDFPQDGAPGSAFITDMETTGGFEGMHEVYIGLDTERPYHVSQQSDPERLVIDIKN